MPTKAGAWRLEEHPNASTWHYHGPDHITVTLVTGDLATRVASLGTVTSSGGIPCANSKAASTCFVAFDGGYVQVVGLADAATVRTFVAAWASGLN